MSLIDGSTGLDMDFSASDTLLDPMLLFEEIYAWQSKDNIKYFLKKYEISLNLTLE